MSARGAARSVSQPIFSGTTYLSMIHMNRGPDALVVPIVSAIGCAWWSRDKHSLKDGAKRGVALSVAALAIQQLVVVSLLTFLDKK